MTLKFFSLLNMSINIEFIKETPSCLLAAKLDLMQLKPDFFHWKVYLIGSVDLQTWILIMCHEISCDDSRDQEIKGS